MASVVVSACGFIPGTSEAGRANIEEFTRIDSAEAAQERIDVDPGPGG